MASINPKKAASRVCCVVWARPLESPRLFPGKSVATSAVQDNNWPLKANANLAPEELTEPREFRLPVKLVLWVGQHLALAQPGSRSALCHSVNLVPTLTEPSTSVSSAKRVLISQKLNKQLAFHVLPTRVPKQQLP